MIEITKEDMEKDTPTFEQFLLEAARAVGAKTAILFDGSEVNLEVNSSDG